MADGNGYPPLLGGLADLTTDGSKAQAAYELDRAELAGSEAAMSEWTRRWGRLAMEALRETDSQADELEAANDEATKAEAALREAGDKAETIAKLVADQDGPVFDRIAEIADEIQELAA